MAAFLEASIPLHKMAKSIQRAIEIGSLTLFAGKTKAGVRITDMDFTQEPDNIVSVVIENTTNVYKQPTNSELEKIVAEEKEPRLESPVPSCFVAVIEMTMLASGDILP